MKRLFLYFIGFLFLLSGMANAALIDGTYRSTDAVNPVQLGTYEHTLSGSYPDFFGSTGSVTSFVSPDSNPNPQWELSNLFRNSGIPGAGYATGNIWNIPITSNYSANYDFLFNGDLYSGSSTYTRTATLTFDMGLDGVFDMTVDPFLAPIDMQIMSASPLNIFEAGTNYQVSFYAELEETWSDGLPVNSEGNITYAELDINAVPIPAAAWLLCSGLIGLVGIRRRFKK